MKGKSFTLSSALYFGSLLSVQNTSQLDTLLSRFGFKIDEQRRSGWKKTLDVSGDHTVYPKAWIVGVLRPTIAFAKVLFTVRAFYSRGFDGANGISAMDCLHIYAPSYFLWFSFACCKRNSKSPVWNRSFKTGGYLHTSWILMPS